MKIPFRTVNPRVLAVLQLAEQGAASARMPMPRRVYPTLVAHPPDGDARWRMRPVPMELTVHGQALLRLTEALAGKPLSPRGAIVLADQQTAGTGRAVEPWRVVTGLRRAELVDADGYLTRAGWAVRHVIISYDWDLKG